MHIVDEAADELVTTGGRASVDVYTADVLAVIAGRASVLAAAEELVADSVGLLLVGGDDGSEGEVEGVVSERDVVRAVAAGLDLATTPVRAIASKDMVRCDLTATVAEVAEVMMERYIRHVLIEEDGRLVGVVSARDLLGAYVSESDA
jgi:CBS domain-containing protein